MPALHVSALSFSRALRNASCRVTHTHTHARTHARTHAHTQKHKPMPPAGSAHRGIIATSPLHHVCDIKVTRHRPRAVGVVMTCVVAMLEYANVLWWLSFAVHERRKLLWHGLHIVTCAYVENMQSWFRWNRYLRSCTTNAFSQDVSGKLTEICGTASQYGCAWWEYS